jgi:hypothetical protein
MMMQKSCRIRAGVGRGRDADAEHAMHAVSSVAEIASTVVEQQASLIPGRDQ